VEFSDWLISNLQYFGKEDYATVFTGHSLGGALAIHGAVDIYLSKFRDNTKFKVYTFGHPRTGNKEFEEVIRNNVVDAYRVTKWRDQVVHVPPCNTESIFDSQCATYGIKSYYPFHTLTEVFYTQDWSSY